MRTKPRNVVRESRQRQKAVSTIATAPKQRTQGLRFCCASAVGERRLHGHLKSPALRAAQ